MSSILNNTDYVVLIAFLIFIGILLYFKVPAMIGKMLDDRAERIRDDLDEARKLREEAQSLLASFERKQKDVQDQADRIVAMAKEEATQASVDAKAELERSITRRLQAADDQIASAEASAVAEVRDQAVAVAMNAARAMIADGVSAAQGKDMIDAAIDDVESKLH